MYQTFHHRKSGLWRAWLLGPDQLIRDLQRNRLGLEQFLIGCMFIMAFYHFGFYHLRTEDRSILYFGVLCLCLALRTLVTGEYQFGYYFTYNWQVMVRLEYISLMLLCLSINLFFIRLFNNNGFRYVKQFVNGLCLVAIAVQLFAPGQIFTYTVYIFYLILVVGSVNLAYILISSLKRREEGSVAFIVGTGILLITGINDTLHHAGVIYTRDLFSIGTIFFIFSQAYILSKRFSNAFARSTELSYELKNVNQQLEDKVQQRTRELEKSNINLLELNEEFASQAEVLRFAHQEIKQKSDSLMSSIMYAKRIQEALLVDWNVVRQHYPESFIFFRPRDIVSGDFYWYSHKEGRTILAMLDCTGHGVPGAFMSIIGNELLKDLTQRVPPAHWDVVTILEGMDQGVRDALKQNLTQQADGMDMAILIIDADKSTVHFAGAKVPLVYMQQEELHVIKGTNRPIGGQRQTMKKFVHHEIIVYTDTTFYLYSDGYQDQFGGEKDTKYMSKRFRNFLHEIHELPMDEQEEVLENELQNWKGEKKQVDDILVIGLRLAIEELKPKR